MVLAGGGEDLCETLPAAGGMLEEDNPCFRAYGPSKYWRDEVGVGHDGALKWTNAFEGEQASNWARWQVEPGADNTYLLEVYVDPSFGRHRSTRYDIKHAGGVDEIVVDQSDASGWVSLGEYPASRRQRPLRQRVRQYLRARRGRTAHRGRRLAGDGGPGDPQLWWQRRRRRGRSWRRSRGSDHATIERGNGLALGRGLHHRIAPRNLKRSCRVWPCDRHTWTVGPPAPAVLLRCPRR